MKFAILALLGSASAIQKKDAPPYFNQPTWNERMPSASGLLQTACEQFGGKGVSCGPADTQLFATGMNGDEDLGQDITMKGQKFHYAQGLAQWTPVVVTSTGTLPVCHGTNGPDGVNCARPVCNGTNGPRDGPSGTPCTREEPASIPAYSTDPTQGRPYQPSGDITPTDKPLPIHALLSLQGDDGAAKPKPGNEEPEKVSVLATRIAKTHTTFYDKI